MAKITSQQSGNLSSGTTWVGGVAPTNGDTIFISSGHTVTCDTSIILGSKVSNVGYAISGSGNFTVANGVTLTLRGTDQSTNSLNNLTGTFTLDPLGGATLLFDLASGDQTLFNVAGVLNFKGTTGNHHTISIPSANKNWGTSGSANVTSYSSLFDPKRTIYTVHLGLPWISNAAGNGPGSFGNSSISVSGTDASKFSTEVATISACNGAGKYCVDYDMGVIYVYSASTLPFSVTFTFKSLTFFSCGFYNGSSSANTQSDFSYCDFNCLGDSTASFTYNFPLGFVNKKTTGAGGTNQGFSVKNCTFNNCYGSIRLTGNTGAANDLFAIEDNKFNSIGLGSSAAQCGFFLEGNPTTYVSFKRNYASSIYPFIQYTFAVATGFNNWDVEMNFNQCTEFMLANYKNVTFDDLIMKNNLFMGPQNGGRAVANLFADSGHQIEISNNLFTNVVRSYNFAGYNYFHDNVMQYSSHHIVSAATADGGTGFYVEGLRLENNILDGYSDGDMMSLGYNVISNVKNASMKNNTFVGGNSALAVGDFTDGGVTSLSSEVDMVNNLVVSCATAMSLRANDSSRFYRTGLKTNDYNNFYGNTANYSNFNQFSTFIDNNGANFNSDAARNILGVVLWNPSYGSAQTGRTLALTYPSANQPSLAWGGGTAVPLRAYTGTATAGTSTTLTDSGATFPTSFTDPANPTGMWVKIRSGTGAGQVNRVTVSTGTVLTFATPWTTAPDNTSVYDIYYSEVQLFDSGGTDYVYASTDMNNVPSTAQTDSNISIEFHTLTQNPNFVDSSRDVLSWNVTQGGSADYSDFMARVKADPTLIPSIVAYIQQGYKPTNTALRGAGLNGADIGAVALDSASSQATHVVGLQNGKFVTFQS